MVKAKDNSDNSQPEAQTKKPSAMGWFREKFREHPRLLHTRNNEEIIRLWLEAHPDQTEMPRSIRNIMANVKSGLKRKLDKKKSPKSKRNENSNNQVLPVRANTDSLDLLEQQIDEALTTAKNLDRDRLAEVIKLLRRARNAVVLMGQ